MSPARARTGARLLVAVAVALGVLAAVTLFGSSAQSEPAWQTRRSVDLTASAIAGPRAAHATDAAYQALRVPVRRVKADATAYASVTCDRCSADARALQILYLDGESGSTVDNVATAWSRCVGCRATALAVQVVVVRGHPRIKANNRALALNTGCRRCHTAAAAFQVVVASERGPRFSSSDRRELRSWVTEQGEVLRTEASSRKDGSSRRLAPGAVARARAAQLRELTQLVNDALGTTTLQRRAQLKAP